MKLPLFSPSTPAEGKTGSNLVADRGSRPDEPSDALRRQPRDDTNPKQRRRSIGDALIACFLAATLLGLIVLVAAGVMHSQILAIIGFVLLAPFILLAMAEKTIGLFEGGITGVVNILLGDSDDSDDSDG